MKVSSWLCVKIDLTDNGTMEIIQRKYRCLSKIDFVFDILSKQKKKQRTKHNEKCLQV